MAATKWDYAIDSGRERLAERGADGWELVSAAVVEGVETFYFKRPRPSIREEITLAQRANVLERKGESAE
ncbi:hypothetical protein [Paenibacillus sp. MBLB4367]|uniref:hypothetical protein n=1 Tax=Paenibacillus sp. MBLB4367 TaxID=3384767 RepID=UPI003907E80B